ncbi:MAG: DUF1810 domain-containing protein [Clostridiales bacterium]|nr:DUF1810 domain-containing protein [Clostridiales bacterium]
MAYDTSNLERFKEAQKNDYACALSEIKRGRKTSHWMWYIFPQLAGLGRSSLADFYGIQGIEEAAAYLADPLLGHRLAEISRVLTQLKTNDAHSVFGSPDNLKLKSCMTLFSLVDGADPVFDAVIEKFFNGYKDNLTIKLLK